MSLTRLSGISTTALLAAALLAGVPAGAQVLVQCPGDVNGDAVPDYCTNGEAPNNAGKCTGNGNDINPKFDPNVQCMHLTGGDGFATMADGTVLYTFGFSDVTGVGDGTVYNFATGKLDANGTPNGELSDDVMNAGTLAAAWPAPLIAVDQGKKFYLTLTNVGMLMRPDLFDPHTVHFHGFPNASSVFDGLPESAISINMGATLTYFYNLVEPGTFMYHCHVEATEHMQMGMLGNLYVRPGQNHRAPGAIPGHLNNGDVDEPPYGDWPNGPDDLDLNTKGRFDEGTIHSKYAYNDGDGSTRYDVEAALQLGGFDRQYHEDHINVQPLPFAAMRDTYPMINGRGYPDTVNPNALTAPAENGGIPSQLETSLITAKAGQKILLRLSNLNITVTHTLTSPSIPMTVVGIDSRELANHYRTNSVTTGGGMSADIILDTAGVAPGTYYLYASNLNYLSNYQEDFGGMMTEIRINP